MNRRIVCFVSLLIVFILKSDSLIIDSDESSVLGHLDNVLKYDNGTIPSLLLLSMPMQFHYSTSFLFFELRARCNAPFSGFTSTKI